MFQSVKRFGSFMFTDSGKFSENEFCEFTIQIKKCGCHSLYCAQLSEVVMVYHIFSLECPSGDRTQQNPPGTSKLIND